MTGSHGAALALDVQVHLDAQIASARHLLDLVLQQGRAIRRRDVDGVLSRLGAIQAEVERRTALEDARTDLLVRAGRQLGVPAGAVTLEQLTSLMTPGEAALVRQQSAQLGGLLAELAREHGTNRALMRQELSFLSHLTRMVGGDPEPAYRPPGHAAGPGSSPAAAPPRPGRPHHFLDLQA